MKKTIEYLVMTNKIKETASTARLGNALTNKEILHRVESIPGFSKMSEQDIFTILLEEITVSGLLTTWDHIPPSKCNVCSNKTMRVDSVGMICITCGFNMDSYTKDVINYVRKTAIISLPEMSNLTGYEVEDIKRFEENEVPDGYYQAFKRVITQHYQQLHTTNLMSII